MKRKSLVFVFVPFYCFFLEKEINKNLDLYLKNSFYVKEKIAIKENENLKFNHSIMIKNFIFSSIVFFIFSLSLFFF